MNRRLNNTLVLGGALLAAWAAAQHYTHLLPGDEGRRFAFTRERCYGVVRAGRNDCGTARHACAGRAPRDAGADEWLSLPAGTCERIAGGLGKPPPGS